MKQAVVVKVFFYQKIAFEICMDGLPSGTFSQIQYNELWNRKATNTNGIQQVNVKQETDAPGSDLVLVT